MPLSPDLLRAYASADYVVFGGPRLVIRVGEPNPDLDALLAEEGAPSAAYVTAANPRGERRSKAENAASDEFLRKALTEKRMRFRAGEGRDPKGFWTPEPSLLVFGIGRGDAQALGRKLGQNAIVFIEIGRAPELVVLA
jgi:hypothetical protein